MIPQSEIQNASLLGEAEGQGGSAFALSDVFVMYDWLQLGDLKFKYRDYNTSSNLTDFNGIERNYSFPNDLGILFKTWPVSDPNKLFALSAKLQDLSVYYYLHQLTSGEVTYSKIIHKEPRSNYPNGNVYRGILKKFDIYSSLDNSVILTSPFNKTVKLPIN